MGWPKIPSGFSVDIMGKTQMSFLANPIIPGRNILQKATSVQEDKPEQRHLEGSDPK